MPRNAEREPRRRSIVVENLTKRYGDVVAVDDISFDVTSGSVFAFLGTNGAGKSTTISCLTTLLPFDEGSLSVAGHDVRRSGDAVRRAIGVVFQSSLLDPLLTVEENLLLRARPYLNDRAALRERVQDLTELVGIAEIRDRRYGTLSGGQRRRTDIARALIPTPSVLFLDEPTTGLDPAGRAAVWETIHGLRTRTGLTVFLTTHYMEETEEADDVCIVDRGRIVAQGSPTALRAAHSSSILSILCRDRDEFARTASHRTTMSRPSGTGIPHESPCQTPSPPAGSSPPRATASAISSSGTEPWRTFS